MRCPNCLYENHEQAEICERCGESLRGENKLFNTCPNCGYINEAGAEFCESCGEAMSPSGLRKSAQKKFAKETKTSQKCPSPPVKRWVFIGFLFTDPHLYRIFTIGIDPGWNGI